MINQLLQEIKKNKKYSSLADSVVKKEIQTYMNSNPTISREGLSRKQLGVLDKQTIKEIRAILHKDYSSFQTKKKNKVSSYLEELKEAKTKSELSKITNKLLSTTVSTKERLNNYQKIYFQIFKITKKPKIIIDLGSGFNPFSYPSMNLPSVTYYAFDINESDIKNLNLYFYLMKKHKLRGKASILDARDIPEKKNKLKQKSDIIFMFKLLDLFDNKTGEQLITTLIKRTKFIVASFPTKTITRKPMNHPHRKGFELMLKRNDLNFKTIKTDNEMFYIISKENA